MAFSVAGKTAIITGAGSGINYCFARLLLQKQCNVIFADIALRPEAKELVSQYSSRSVFDYPRAVFQKTDVTDWSQLDRAFKTAQEEFNGADIVCPGAGVYEPVR
jgi:3-hydroxybutyrate dehydrogenase